MISFKLIPANVRLEVRAFSRQVLLDADGDADLAKAWIQNRLKEHLQKKFGSVIVSLLISLAIKLAIELIVYWVKQPFMIPPEGAFIPGEPGA
jgi:hypothetical protein